jgi:ribosomal protein S18 acetylase RimI-like enzyme
MHTVLLIRSEKQRMYVASTCTEFVKYHLFCSSLTACNALHTLTPQTEFPPRPYISDVAVRRANRRQGIGTLLMKECERIVAAWGCPAIYLKVQAKNPAGVALYERLGYHQARPADDKVSLRSKLLM